MSLETKRIKELFGYARTLTKEQGVGVMAARAAGFFKRRFFGKKARYLPAKQTHHPELLARRQVLRVCSVPVR